MAETSDLFSPQLRDYTDHIDNLIATALFDEPRVHHHDAVRSWGRLEDGTTVPRQSVQVNAQVIIPYSGPQMRVVMDAFRWIRGIRKDKPPLPTAEDLGMFDLPKTYALELQRKQYKKKGRGIV